MVSFFGLKFGGEKKKKPAEPKSSNPWQKVDQNLMGEGQFFGKEVGSHKLVNGSVRSMSMPRPGTAHSMRSRSPYMHNTHQLAASSMYDLSNISRSRSGSFMSVKPSPSDATLGLNFSSASMTNLTVPTLGSLAASPRPGTATGMRTKPWVNPLDVHFNRATPSTPRSPLGQFEFSQPEWSTPTPQPDVDSTSLFGDRPENVVNAIMSSVSQRDKAEKEREEQERELRRLKEAEQERLAAIERRKQATAPLQRSPPRGPTGYPSPPRSIHGPTSGAGPGIPGQRLPGQANQSPGGWGASKTGPPMGYPRGPMSLGGPIGEQNGSGPPRPFLNPVQKLPTYGPPLQAAPPPPNMRPRQPATFGPNGIPSPPGSVPPPEHRPQLRPEKPFIQDLEAKRETVTYDSPARHSISMEIEEFEKVLTEAAHVRDRPLGPPTRPTSDASSLYDDDEPEMPLPIQKPAPSPTHSSPFMGPLGPYPDREQSPMRSAPGPRKSSLGAVEGFTPSPHPGPPLRLTPTPTAIQVPLPESPPRGDKADEPGPAAPPTPDSANWPLATPSPPPAPAANGGAPRMARPNIPPPLKFDFFPVSDGGPFTPPLRKVAEPAPAAPGPEIAGELRRPNFGLKAPTGIADDFGTGFI